MRNLSKIALASLLAAGLAGGAVAAARGAHVMTVSLPDGSVAKVEYVGDVAPKVVVEPSAGPQLGLPAGFGIPPIDGLFASMDREMAAAMGQIDQLSRQPLGSLGTGATLAGLGSAPAGTTSYSTVSISQNGRTCSRSTEVIGQGAGKPPKVISNVSGDCAPEQRGAARPPVSGTVHQS